MKKILFLFSFSFLIFSCGEEVFVFTMSEEDLVNILYDLQVAEAAIQTVHSSVKDSVITVYYDQIFELHGINQDILLRNIECLKRNPAMAHKVYKKVLEFHKEGQEKNK